MSRVSLVRAIESVANGQFGQAAEKGLRRIGLLPPIQSLYNASVSALVIWKGEYPISVGDATALIKVESTQEYLRVKSMFEDDVLAELLSEIESDDVFFDIGANVGVYSCLVGDLLTDGSVTAFEPHPNNALRLRENLSRNGVEARVVQKALSDEGGEVSLAVAVESHTTSPGHNLIEINEAVEDYGRESSERETTDMLRGDEFVSVGDTEPPTVVKVDVEGAELNVLRGLEETLSREECRLLFCEVHRNHMKKFSTTESELRDFLRSCNFRLEDLNDHGSKFHLKASKEAT